MKAAPVLSDRHKDRARNVGTGRSLTAAILYFPSACTGIEVSDRIRYERACVCRDDAVTMDNSGDA